MIVVWLSNWNVYDYLQGRIEIDKIDINCYCLVGCNVIFDGCWLEWMFVVDFKMDKW